MPAPLHQAFLALQCIYNIFLGLFKWSATAIGWKRINHKDVSQNFHLCRQLAFLILEELERLAFDQFTSQNKDCLNACLEENGDEQSFAIKFSTKHEIFVQEKITNEVNEYSNTCLISSH